MLFWIRVAGFTLFYIRVAGFDSILDQSGPLGRRGTNMLKVSVLDKRS